MKKSMIQSVVLFALTLSLSATSFAHLEVGTYTGRTATQEPCEFEVLGIHHEGAVPHPLNERVSIQVQSQEFTIFHPPVLDEQKGLVRFNHDRFTGFKGVPGAGLAVILEMEHSEQREGPSSISLLQDNYKDASQSSQWKCQDLVFQGQSRH